MGRVALFLCFSVFFKIFDRKFDKGHSHLTKRNFDSVENWSVPIKFYWIDFVSKLCPW